MKRVFSLGHSLFPVALIILAAHFFLSHGIPPSTIYRFEFKLASPTPGQVRVFFDLGNGFTSEPSYEENIEPGNILQRHRLKLPHGSYHGLRLELIDSHSTVTVADARIVTMHNRVIRTFSPDDFVPVRASLQILRGANQSLLVTIPDASSPGALDINLPRPLTLKAPSALLGWTIEVVAWYLACLAGAFVFLRIGPAISNRAAKILASMVDYFRLHPGKAVAATALFAVILNCYPIVFLGRSFVSPNFGTVLLYERRPTLPDFHDEVMEDSHGSDVGAMIWQNVPYSMIEHRALFRDHQLPLWNRFNSFGTPLLGQGQSMFGDPLHLFVIAANGAAWSWDLKFMAAKWLLALGLGLIVLHGTRHLPSAALVAFSAPFIGFFLYRLNHPSFFSFCYAPWILYTWCRLASAPNWRSSAGWSAALLLACWTELNSGTVKEAYMTLITMNVSGLLVLLLADICWAEKFKKILLATWTGGLFIMISAPIWLTFYDTLKVSYTCSDSPQSFQIHPAALLGLFDEIFYRPFSTPESVYNPAANFLVLLGVIYALATFRRTPANRLKVAIAVASFIPLAIAFALVPPEWIINIPFVAKLIHVSDVFSPLLIIDLMVLAGFGYHAAATRLGTPEGRGDLIVSGLFLFAVIFPYIALTHLSDHGAFPMIYVGPRLPVDRFVWGSLVSLLVASMLLAWVVRRASIRKQWSPAGGILAAICLVVLLWRQGPHARIGYNDYVFHPSGRADFHAASPVVAAMQDNQGPPFRAAGFDGTLFPGWTGVYGIEGICGPDALASQYYHDLLDACGVDRPWIWRYTMHVNTVAALKKVYDFLNIKYYLGLYRDQSLLIPTLIPTKTDEPDQVYVSPTVWPRAFFTDRLLVYDTPADLAQLIHTGDGRPFAAIQSVDRIQASPLPNELAGRTVVPATDYLLTNNSTSFNVTASKAGVIVLQESWLKDDFRVQLNGQPAPYIRINHMFKGVVVNSAGLYHVSFTYRPHRFNLALLLAGTGMLLFVAGTWRLYGRGTAAKTPPLFPG
jgi:hypothetical protein